MRKCGRIVLLSFLGLLSTAVLGAVAALLSAVSLAATALIVPGTGTPDANVVINYKENFRDYYIDTLNPSCSATSVPVCKLNGIDYFASFWPLVFLSGWCEPGRCEKFDVSVADGVANLDAALTTLLENGYTDDIIISGYSQGARVATVEKINLAGGGHGDLTDQISFVFIGNTNRPNGGILSRFGILGHIPILDVTTGQPTPTDTGYATTDYAIRWEGIADMTLYPANPVSLVNSLLGFWFDHGTYLAVNQNSDPGELPGGWPVELWQDFIDNPGAYPDIVDVQVHGDTTYYTITPRMTPIARAVQMVPVIGVPIANLIDPALRVFIETTGYDRSISFGEPTRARLIPIFNPITLALDLVPAIVEGVENMLAGGAPLPTPVTPVSDATVSTLAEDESQPVAAIAESETTEASTTEAVAATVGDEDAAADSAAAKVDRETAKAEREAAREAAKAERKAAREAAKAEREAAREAAKAEREAAREAAKAEREAAEAEREAARAAAAEADDDTDQAAA